MTQVVPSYSHLQGHGSSVDTAQPTTLPGNNHTNSDPQGGAMQNDKAEDDGVINGKVAEGGVSHSVDIFINNVVCTFSVRCHLNLQRIGLDGINVEYRREYGKVNMRFRNPRSTATIWSSGKITMTGNDSADHAKLSARRCARALQKLGFRVRFSNYKVVNVLGTCGMPFGIKIANFSREYPREASYEPELHPAVTYRIKLPKATLKIFSTGSITCTAPSVENVQSAIHHIYPLVLPFKKYLTDEQLAARGNQSKNNPNNKPQPPRKRVKRDDIEEGEVVLDEEEESEGEESEEIDEDMYSSDDSDL